MSNEPKFKIGQHVYVFPSSKGLWTGGGLWKTFPSQGTIVYIIDNKYGNERRYLYEVEIPGEAGHYFRWAKELYTDAAAACQPLKERVEEELSTLTRYLEDLNEFSKSGGNIVEKGEESVSEDKSCT